MGTVNIHKDALIVTYTDGITDLQNKNDEYFEVPILKEFAIKNAHFSAKDFNDELLDFMDEFRGDKSFPDDLSVLTCKIF